MKEKRISIILLLCVILGLLGIYLLFDSFNYDLNFTDKHDSDYWVKIWQLRNHPEITYNYFHGLWLIPFGIIFALILILLEFPTYEDIYKKLKKDLKKKGIKPPH